MKPVGLMISRTCVGVLVVFSIVLAVAVAGAVQGRPDAATDADAIKGMLDAGAYADAERLASAWVATVERDSGAESLDAARASDLLVAALLRNGRAGAADTRVLAERAVRLKERRLLRDDPDLALSLDNLGAVYTDRGEMGAAVPVHQRAVAVRRLTVAPDDASLADSLDHLALPLILLQRFGDAAQALEESQRIRERAPSRSPLALSRTLYIAALLRRYDGGYALAESLLDRALEIRRRLQPPDHPEIRSAIQLQGDLFFLQGNISGARNAWSTALEIAERTLRPGHPDIAITLRLVALAAKAFGDLTMAQQMLDRALAIGEQSFGPCHQELSGLLNDLAGITMYLGDYTKAQKLYATALGTRERCLGRNDQRTATVIHNQALLAAEMGDLALAERLHARAIRMWSTGLGPNHPYVARGLDALAEVVATRGQPARARALYERALGMRQRMLGPDHPEVAWTLTNIARLAGMSDNLELALKRLDQAIEIYQRVGAGDEPDHLARSLALRGTLEGQHGNFPAARTSFDEALVMRERIFGAGHPLVAEARADVAGVDLALGEPDSAQRSALDAERIGRDHLLLTIRYLPERHAMAYARKRPRGLDLALSIAASTESQEPSPVLDAVIQSRGVVLDELAARARSAVDVDPELTLMNASLAAAHGRFANLMLRSLQGEESVPRALLDEARKQKEEAERTLAEKSVISRANLLRARVGLEEVRRALPPRSALVSFVRYDRTTFTTTRARTISRVVPSYIAFVISPATAVTAVPLGAATTLDSTVSSWRREVEGRSMAAGVASREAERTYRAAGARLRQRIWDPLAEHIGDVSYVFIVPDGALNLVSFAALPIKQNEYLVESGPVIHFLSTERDLISPDAVSSGRGLLAVGGPTYDLQVPGPVRSGSRRSGCENPGPLRFEDLPGSRAEIQDIARIWSPRPLAAGTNTASGDEVTVLSGRAATKSAVIKAATGRRIVHLATHGFFLGSPCESAPGSARGVGGLGRISSRLSILADNPLLFAGLAFAGANRRASGGSGEDAGILTAEEVAALNLQGTEWAVLSACDTGLGEIRAGEGVFGLRRAFRIAGARTIIMSLWSVEDQSTRNWMRALYEGRFQQQLTTADAVHHANVSIVRNRRARGQSTHPFYWAAFLAAGDWK